MMYCIAEPFTVILWVCGVALPLVAWASWAAVSLVRDIEKKEAEMVRARQTATGDDPRAKKKKV